MSQAKSVEATFNGTTPPPSGSFGDAVDNRSLVWTTGGNTNWFRQTAVSYSGGDAAQSGNISDNQSSWMQATVTGPGILSFYWKVSSENGYDYLKFFVDGSEQIGRISGDVGWQKKRWNIPAGSHTIKWVYIKDASMERGSDTGWLDKVVFTASEP